MIQMLEIRTGSAIWEIDGTILRFRRLKNVGDAVVERRINQYKSLLLEERYRANQEELIGITEILGEVILLKIGSEAFYKKFFQMFRFYCSRFMEAWKSSEKYMVSNKVSMFPALHYMFYGKVQGTEACNLAALRGLSCGNEIFQKIFREEFAGFWIKEIGSIVARNESLKAVADKIGIRMVMECAMELQDGQLLPFLMKKARTFTDNRTIITAQSYYRMILGKEIGMNRNKFFAPFVDQTDQILEKEYALQCRKFPRENEKELSDSKETWRIFFMHGPTLCFQTIDFTSIACPSLRAEVKSYMRYRLRKGQARGEKGIYSISEALNCLSESNPLIRFFTDISEIEAKTLYMKMEKTCGNTDGKAVSEIMRVFSLLSLIFEYLMGDERENNLKTPVPRINPFAKFRFHNAREYKIRTDVIPESVMEQIEIHLDELDESQRLIYHIFSQTGMRMKEVLFLEENCLEETQYEGLMQIRYTPYKTLKARRKKGAPDYHRVFISQKLAEDIRDEIKKRQDWRQELGVPYIFVNKRPGFRTGMLNMGNYILLMNKLIKENHICGEDGELWRFTSKQQRKTLAVTLIENGGTVEELAYWLGHLNRNTAANYYAEVRKMKLAELNTKFFREKFNLLLSGEQLAEYSEEERRLLYMDFRLDQRRVEFGFCMKKMAEGGCGQRNSLHNCVNCRNLCTGEKYLSHWLELLESQVLTVQVMEEKYRLAGITEYQSFKEYERAVFLRDCYKNIVERIKVGGER